MTVNPWLPNEPDASNATLRDDPQPDATLDITTRLCPMTFVHTRLALDRLAPGQVLAVRLRGEEPVRNVPRTAAEQGHTVLSCTVQPDGDSVLLIRRK